MPKIVLKECPKVYIRETHRAKEPAATLELVEKIRKVAGINEIVEVSGCDRTRIPAFICERVRPDGSKTTHTGKGLTDTQARVSLIMEAIERYSSEYRDDYFGGLVRGSYAGLRGRMNVLNPEELILSPYSEYSRDIEFLWARGFDLVSGAEILVPACEVYHPFHLDPATMVHTHTNGLASGNTLEEAVFHALSELIERDAWSIAKFRNEPGQVVLVENIPENDFLIAIIDRFEAADIRVVVKNITSDVGVPVMAAFSSDTACPEMVVMDGFGAHLDPRAAMARALLELAVTRSVFLKKYGRDGLCESLLLSAQEEDNRFYCDSEIALGELPAQFSGDIAEDIAVVLEKLRTRGLEKVIVADLSREDTGVPVVRVIVPGLENYCFDRGRRGARLFGHARGEEEE
ncbi:MAG: YcaO-like family protein [Syntrophobacteraceae bacterium]